MATKQDAMEAYVPILTEHLDKYPLIFQPYPTNRLTTGGKKTRRSDPVTVIWDDGEMMTMTFQGSQREYPSKDNPLMVYPKQLSYGDVCIIFCYATKLLCNFTMLVLTDKNLSCIY